MRRGGGREKEGGEKEGVRDWVSSDCVSGQLHMFLIKVLTLWDQLHTGMLVFVIRLNVLWSGGSLKNRASPGPSLQLTVLKPRKNNYSDLTYFTTTWSAYSTLSKPVMCLYIHESGKRVFKSNLIHVFVLHFFNM